MTSALLWLRGKFEAFLFDGLNPKTLSWSVATGFAVSLFPIFGLTTTLGLIAGYIFKLHHPSLQLANQLAFPLQIICIPVFAWIGEQVTHSPHVSFDPRAMSGMFLESPVIFLKAFGKTGLLAVFAWSFCIPMPFLLVRLLCFKIFSRMKFQKELKNGS